MKNEEDIINLKNKLEKFRKEKCEKFGGSDYSKLRGWIDALSWVLTREDYMIPIKNKFTPKFVELLSEFK